MTIDLKSKLGGDKLFFASYSLFLITSILSTTFYYKFFMGRPYMWLQILCVVLLLGYEYCSNGLRGQNWKAMAVCAALFLLTFRVSHFSTQRQMVLMFAYIYCARNIPFAKIARITLDVSIALVLTVVVTSYFGFVENIAAFKSGRIREYMGFRYALFLPGQLLNMTALWLYLKKDTITVPEALAWAAANWFVYYQTDSRISFFIAEGLIVTALFMRFLPKVTGKMKPIWWLAAASFIFCAVFSLIITMLYDGSLPWMRKLNTMLESRLRLGHASLIEHGVTFFGQEIEWLGNGLDAFGNSAVGTYSYVDCLYVKMLQRYGILFMLGLAVLTSWSMYRLYKRREYHILLICATVAVHSILDDLAFTLHYNTFWLAMGVVLINQAMLNWDGKTTQVSVSKTE